MNDQLQVWINTLVGTGLSFAAGWFWWKKNQAIAQANVDIAAAKDAARSIAEEHQKVLLRLVELETTAKLSAQQFSPIVTAFQAILVKQLTHPSKDELDQLLVKVGPPHILTPDESARLAVMLKERSHDMGSEITSTERESAEILPIVMKMAIAEQENIAAANLVSPAALKLITVLSVVTDGVRATESKPPKDVA